MRGSDALEELERYAAAKGHDLSRLTGADAVNLMVGFYRDVRAEGCDPQQAADLLMFQCGSDEAGTGEHFELDLARQLFLPGAEPNAEGVIEDADDYIWRLHLTLRFVPTPPALRALPSEEGFCGSPQDVDEFVGGIRRGAAYGLVHDRSDAKVVLTYACAG